MDQVFSKPTQSSPFHRPLPSVYSLEAKTRSDLIITYFPRGCLREELLSKKGKVGQILGKDLNKLFDIPPCLLKIYVPSGIISFKGHPV